MTQAIPENLRASRALKFITERGWNWQGDGSNGQIQVETCPFCGKGNFKFYCAVCDPKDSSRDGLFFCHHGSCAKTGNLRTLQEHLGVRIPGVDSRAEWAGTGSSKPDSLPDADVCHTELLGDAESMDYLMHVRGFTQDVINRQKLGLKEKVWFRKAGETKALVIPYLSAEGNVTYVKYRTLPPAEKDFITPSGWDAQLFNGQVLQEGCKEIMFLEGECDVLSCMSNGIEYAVGVPGANVKKAEWIATLDKVAPEKIYLLYDNDTVGQRAAQEMASRIGIDKCLKILLPKGTKDINDFFTKGGTLEEFEKLKSDAQLFDVTGVTSSGDALRQLEDELNGKVDLAPTYTFSWPELNRMIGMEDGDVLDILAPAKIGKTTFGMNIMDHMVAQYGEDGLIVCLEMTQARLARKWVALVTGFEDVLTEANTEASRLKRDELLACVVKARSIQQSRDADLYFAYPQLVKEPEDVFKLIRDCIRRYGVKWVMLDNVHRLCDAVLKNQAHRTVQLSQISKGLSMIAKDYRIKMIRILQPNKGERGGTVSTYDVDGSSQIDKDCDGMVTLWRAVVGEQKKSEWEAQQEGFEETYESFSPVMRVAVGLSRYSAGGTTKLFYDGARSQVRSLPESQKVAPQKNFNGIIMEGGGTQQVIPTEETTTVIPTEDGVQI